MLGTSVTSWSYNRLLSSISMSNTLWRKMECEKKYKLYVCVHGCVMYALVKKSITLPNGQSRLWQS